MPGKLTDGGLSCNSGDVDIALVRPCPGKVVRGLHAKKRIGVNPESLFKSDRHVGG
jgi:hypothetical protein